MHFDPQTLMLPSAFVLLFAGIMSSCAYYRLRGEKALLWWSAASLLNALIVSLLLMGTAWGEEALLAAGSCISTVAAPLYWAGIRRFNGRKAPAAVLAGGIAAWVATTLLLQFAGQDPKFGSMIVSLAVWPVFAVASMAELWSTRNNGFAYRWPLIGFLALHAFAYLGGVHDAFNGYFAIGAAPPLLSWFGMVHFDTIVFAMGGTTALVLMARERQEQTSIEAANIDPLTGAANRRILFDGAERLHQRCSETNSPLSVVMFDLDHFKHINDTLGHKAGDKVIRGFADVMRSFLRANDLFGRYGGEEFILILPNVSAKAAYAIADRARHAFSKSYSHLDGHPIGMTVSAGVAMAAPDNTLDAALAAADTAMYAAKQAGRNRVMCAGSALPGPEDNIVRIA